MIRFYSLILLVVMAGSSTWGKPLEEQLAIYAEFLDENGNGTLDAEERGQLQIEVVNHGPRIALTLKASIFEHNFQARRGTLLLGTLAAQAKAEATLVLIADEHIKNERLRIRLEVKENQGQTATRDFTITLATQEVRNKDTENQKNFTTPQRYPSVSGRIFEKKRGFNIFFENDKILLKGNDDQNYTMGVGFRFTGELGQVKNLNNPFKWMWGTLNALPRILTHFDQLFPWGDIQDRFSSEPFWMFGHTAFTPNDLSASCPILDDRPYASLLFFNVQKVTPSASDNTRYALTTDLTVGVLGLGIAKHVQTKIHKTGDPQGWHNQISNGGELTAMYQAKVEYLPRLINDHFSNKKCKLEYTLQGLGSLGYYTAFSGGITARLGIIASKFWRWSPNRLGFATQTDISIPGVPLITGESKTPPKSFELYAFGSLRGRATLYNALLQGQFRRSAVTVDIKHFHYEGEVGLTLSKTCSGCTFNFTYVCFAGRSPEFYSKMNERAHSWGGLSVGIHWQ